MMRPLAAGLAGLLFLLAAVPALLPAEMNVSRSAVLHGDAATITKLVSHYPERLAWVAWTEIDPAAQYTFGGEPGAPGSTMAWIGEEIGTAELTLKRVDPGREVVGTLAYSAPFAMTSTDRIVLEPLPDGTTRVTWTASAPLPYGPSRLFGVFADGMLGPDYERGLERLEDLLTAS